MHVRAELAFAAPAHDVVHQRVLGLRLALRPRAPDDAADVAALEQHEIERELGYLAGGEADYEIAPLPAERAHRRFGVRPADRVVHHVDAALATEPPERAAQIFAGVVHR